MRRPEIPEMRVPAQLDACSSTYPGAAGALCCGFDQPRGTSTSAVPRSAAVSAVKPKVSSLVDPAVTRVGVTVIFPGATRVAAPPPAASTSTPRPTQSATPLTRVTRRAVIDPARVYLDGRTSKARTTSLVGVAESPP